MMAREKGRRGAAADRRATCPSSGFGKPGFPQLGTKARKLLTAARDWGVGNRDFAAIYEVLAKLSGVVYFMAKRKVI